MRESKLVTIKEGKLEAAIFGLKKPIVGDFKDWKSQGVYSKRRAGGGSLTRWRA